MSTEDQQAFQQKLESFVGAEAGPFLGWDAVNRAMIRHWCDAMGDTNPAYVDPSAAELVGGQDGGVVAPATMLQAWTMVGYGATHRPGSDTREGMPVTPVLEDAGYLGVVATNCEQEYFEPVREGDEITSTSKLESISERKQTGLGEGHFVTQLTEYHNQNGDLVGTMRFRILKYDPSKR